MQIVTVPVGPKIVLVDRSVMALDVDIGPAVAALARQANEHFALPPPYGYGIGCRLRQATAERPPEDDEWQLILTDPLFEDALGWHEHTAAGQPVMYVFPNLARVDGSSWTVTASHEILETLADPNIARCAQDVEGRFWAYEVADPTQADEYEIDGVRVSNFVLPPYFEPIENATRFDFMGLITAPLELRPGGYSQYWDPAGGWLEANGARLAQHEHRVASELGVGRGARRRKAWLARR